MMVCKLQPQIMPPGCIGIAGQNVVPPWFGQLLIEEDNDQEEPPND
jgi:hypothetical protein